MRPANTGPSLSVTQSLREVRGGRAGVVRLGDRPDDHDPAGTGLQDLVEVAEVDSADGEPGAVGAEGGGVPDQAEAGGVPAGLGGGRPAGTGAEVVDAVLDRGSGGLRLGVRGAAYEDVVAEDRAGGGDGQVALADVQHTGARRVGDVGPVVDREELAVPRAGVGEDLEVFQFLGRLHALVAQLHDVDAPGQDRVQELAKVTLALAGVRAEIDAGV